MGNSFFYDLGSWEVDCADCMLTGKDHLAEEQDRMLEEPRQPRPAHTKASRWSTQGLGRGGDWADTEDSSYVVSTALK